MNLRIYYYCADDKNIIISGRPSRDRLAYVDGRQAEKAIPVALTRDESLATISQHIAALAVGQPRQLAPCLRMKWG